MSELKIGVASVSAMFSRHMRAFVIRPKITLDFPDNKTIECDGRSLRYDDVMTKSDCILVCFNERTIADQPECFASLDW